MKNLELILLIEKYLCGTASDDEKRILGEWYISNTAEEIVWPCYSSDEERLVELRMFNELKKHLRADT